MDLWQWLRSLAALAIGVVAGGSSTRPGLAGEAHGEVGRGDARLEDDAHAAGGGEPAAAAGDGRPRRCLQVPPGPPGGLRPLRAVAALPEAGRGRARAPEGREDVLGLLAHRSHDDRLPGGHQGPSRRAQLQHHPPVDGQDREARPLSRGSRPAGLELHPGERVPGPDLQGGGGLLRAPPGLVHPGGLHRRARQEARVGPPLHDLALGGAERARPGAKPDSRGLHPPLRRGGGGDARACSPR